MSIYIYKNNRQKECFAGAKVLQRFAVTKDFCMKMPLKKTFILPVCLLLFIVIGCKTGSLTQRLPVNNNSSPQTTATPDEYTVRRNSIYHFLEKTKETWESGFTTQLNPKARINGKIALVWHSRDDSIVMPLFKKESDSGYSKINSSQLEYYGFKEQEIAIKPEEIDTLIRVSCEKGDEIGNYQFSGLSQFVTAYAMKCKIEVIDYKNHILFAEREIINRKKEKNIEAKLNQREYVLDPPFDEIRSYLKTLKGK